MKYLVFCPCGHGLDRHAQEGCAGDGHAECPCSRSQDLALDAAIEHARSHPWGPSADQPVVGVEAV